MLNWGGGCQIPVTLNIVYKWCLYDYVVCYFNGKKNMYSVFLRNVESFNLVLNCFLWRQTCVLKCIQNYCKLHHCPCKLVNKKGLRVVYFVAHVHVGGTSIEL